LQKKIHLLSPGHCDCVALIATACHLCEFKALDPALHSQVYSVTVLKKQMLKVVQKECLEKINKTTIQLILVALIKMVYT
jgi:hypothetical protein